MRFDTAVNLSVALATLSCTVAAVPSYDFEQYRHWRHHHHHQHDSDTSVSTTATPSAPPQAPEPTFSAPPSSEPTFTTPSPQPTESVPAPPESPAPEPAPTSSAPPPSDPTFTTSTLPTESAPAPEPTETGAPTSTTETAAPVPSTETETPEPSTEAPLPPVVTEAPSAPSSTELPIPQTTEASTPAPGTGSPAPPPAADCTCGYKLTAHGDAYFPKAFNADFASIGLSGVAPSADWLTEYGIYITDGWQAGAVGADGTKPIGHYQNVRINNGTLELVVPGGQSAGGETTNAQLEGPIAVNGVFTMEAKIDPTPGTCQAIFTYHTQEVSGNDEQDIEILGSYLFESGDNGTPPGIELTNYNPSLDGGNDNVIVPFPSDPTTDFHSYTLAWLSSGTQYLYDGTLLKSPSKFTSVNPSSIIVNHWTNGDHGFTQGPPATEAVMQLKRFYGYYAPPGEAGMPSGCSDADVCVV